MKALDDRYELTAGMEPRRYFRSAAEAAWLRESVPVGQSPLAAAPAARQRDEERIRLAAYFRAERRGFAPGHELEDWLEAEREAGMA